MKKVFAAACSMALMFSLAACGSPAEQQDEAVDAQPVQGLTDEASVAKARALMEGLIASPAVDNMTEVDAVSTATDVDGATYRNISTITRMRDVTGDVPKFFIKTETDPASESDSTYYIEGTEGVLEVEGDRRAITFEESYIDSLVDPEDNSEQFRVYYDCAEQISYYEQDGTEYVMITVDPAKLMESGIFADAFSDITGCVAEYTFDADGNLVAFISTVEGTMIGTDGGSVGGSVETKCLFTDYGTTQVPALPEITETGAGDAEGAGEDQSGE